VPQETKLSSEEEKKFREWYSKWAEYLDLDPDPDNPLHYYDYRAAYKAGAAPTEESGWHWPSEFKREGHPNLIVDGINTRTGKPVSFQASRPGQWDDLQRATQEAKASNKSNLWNQVQKPPAPTYGSENEMALFAPVDDILDEDLNWATDRILRSLTQNMLEREYAAEQGLDTSRQDQLIQELQARFNELRLESEWRSSNSYRRQQQQQQTQEPQQTDAGGSFNPRLGSAATASDLASTIREAWSRWSAPQPATSRLAGDPFNPGQMATEAIPAQDYGSIGNAVARTLGFMSGNGDDPFFGAGPAGSMAKMTAFPSRASKSAYEGLRGAGGQKFNQVADLRAYLFDPDAPGRGIHDVRGVLAERARNPGLELNIRRAEPVWAASRGSQQHAQSLGAMLELMKDNPTLAQALAESLARKGISVEDFVRMQSQAVSRDFNAARKGGQHALEQDAAMKEVGEAFIEALQAQDLITAVRGPTRLGDPPSKIIPFKPGQP
jgi:hypothetical protein